MGDIAQLLLCFYRNFLGGVIRTHSQGRDFIKKLEEGPWCEITISQGLQTNRTKRPRSPDKHVVAAHHQTFQNATISPMTVLISAKTWHIAKIW